MYSLIRSFYSTFHARIFSPLFIISSLQLSPIYVVGRPLHRTMQRQEHFTNTPPNRHHALHVHGWISFLTFQPTLQDFLLNINYKKGFLMYSNTLISSTAEHTSFTLGVSLFLLAVLVKSQPVDWMLWNICSPNPEYNRFFTQLIKLRHCHNTCYGTVKDHERFWPMAISPSNSYYIFNPSVVF